MFASCTGVCQLITGFRRSSAVHLGNRAWNRGESAHASPSPLRIQCPPLRCRGGFTLLELTLVVAILVLLASIALPILGSVLDRQKLRGAAEELRLAWDNARLKAMRTGQTQVFRCELDSGAYTVFPLVLHDDENNVGEGATFFSGGMAVQTSASQFGMTTTATDSRQFGEKNLDESISFVSCQVAGDPRAFSLAQTGASADVSITNVTQMVFFYPDGTTSTAEAIVRNKNGEQTGVQMRGLTGHSRVLGITFSNSGSQK